MNSGGHRALQVFQSLSTAVEDDPQSMTLAQLLELDFSPDSCACIVFANLDSWPDLFFDMRAEDSGTFALVCFFRDLPRLRFPSPCPLFATLARKQRIRFVQSSVRVASATDLGMCFVAGDLLARVERGVPALLLSDSDGAVELQRHIVAARRPCYRVSPHTMSERQRTDLLAALRSLGASPQPPATAPQSPPGARTAHCLIDRDTCQSPRLLCPASQISNCLRRERVLQTRWLALIPPPFRRPIPRSRGPVLPTVLPRNPKWHHLASLTLGDQQAMFMMLLRRSPSCSRKPHQTRT